MRQISRPALVAALLTGLVALLVGLHAAPASAASESLFGSTVPAIKADSDAAAVTVGTAFRAKKAGQVTAVRFYKGTGNSGPHVGAIYAADGLMSMRVNFTRETASGWQTATLRSPVYLSAGATFVAAVSMPNGHYAATSSYPWPKSSTSLTGTRGVYTYGSGVRFPKSTYQSTSYFVDVSFTPGEPASASSTGSKPPNASTSPRPRVTPKPTTSPSPTATASTPAASAGTLVLGRRFPDAATTGVPAGTKLTPYTGPCTIQQDNTVIEARTVSCGELRVFAKGLVIRSSVVNGSVYVDYTAREGSFVISDSTVNVGNGVGTGLGDAFFTATRVQVTGGTRSINCYAECTVADSYVHGQFRDKSGQNHESGIRVNTNSRLVHNTITCDAPNYPPDAGCSAAITGYPDFDPVVGNVIENNLVSSSTGAGYCAYGGSTTGKPYSGQTRNITFKNNVFRRGTSSGAGGVQAQCGYWGPITSFDVKAPGNVWTNNLFDDGLPVAPAN